MGHAVRSASTGMAGLQQVVDDPPDVVVLDLGLPDIDGTELLKMLRAVSAVPVIVATARDDEQRHRGHPRRRRRRLHRQAVLGRAARRPHPGRAAPGRRERPARPRSRSGELRVDVPRHEATLAGEPLDLTRKEFELLAHLAANAGHVVTKRQLLADIWQQPYGGADKTVDVHLSWLRRKLGETAAEPRYLRTIRGVGVKLVDPEA